MSYISKIISQFTFKKIKKNSPVFFKKSLALLLALQFGLLPIPQILYAQEAPVEVVSETASTPVVENSPEAPAAEASPEVTPPPSEETVAPAPDAPTDETLTSEDPENPVVEPVEQII